MRYRWTGAARVGVVALAAVLCAALMPARVSFAQAPSTSETAKSAAGTWEMSNAERDRSCMVTLRAGAAATVAWGEKCAEAFPFSRGVATWRLGPLDAIQLVDANGQVVLELTEVEGGLYEGERPGEGLVFLQSAASSAAEQLKPEQLAGEWAFVRAAGKPVCRVTLTTAAARNNALALKLKPGCDALVRRFGPAAWRIEREQLVLLPARGDEVWRFEENEPGVWRRVPESEPALRLVRQQ